jgi:DNA-binding transcriptional ArsR family regulator
MTTLTSAPRPGYQLRLGAPDALPVSVALTPQQSVIGLIHQAASGQSLGAPAGLLAAIRTALRPQARFAVRSFAARGPSLIPECSAPISPLAAASVTEQSDRLREVPAEKLTGLLQTGYDGRGFPPCWEAAGDEPRRWLSSMADASLDTWTVIEPRWRAAGRLFDRELRRVGIAAVRGGMAALLNSLHPRISYANGTLTFAHPHQRCVTLGRRRLVLMPMIAGRDSVLASFERPGVCCIGYPVRAPSPGPPAASNGALAMILGQLRAAILQALRQPLTVSDLAADVHCAPTTATYHLHQLAAAGLIIREPCGIRVRVSRTARGDELVDLLAD